MWFRFSGGSTPDVSNGSQSTDATSSAITGSTEPTTFEKFKRASFRRKSGIKSKTTRQRSKSPHYVLKNEINDVIKESLKEDDSDKESEIMEKKDLKKPIEIIGNNELKENLRYFNEVKIPINPVNVVTEPNKNSIKSKKPTFRTLKRNELKKTKSNKNLTISSHCVPNNGNIPTTNRSAFVSVAQNKAKNSYSSESETDSSDNTDVEESIPQRCKEKIILTDPKYKHNRIAKSSSKTKIGDYEKRESVKRSRSARKIVAPLILVDESKNNNKDKSGGAGKKNNRVNSNLNLQTIVQFVMNNKKFLNTDEFALIRRKTISEAASTVMGVVSTRKPAPIALRYSGTYQDCEIADSPRDSGHKAEQNVVLVKKQAIKNSFNDNDNHNNNHINNNNNDIRKNKMIGKSSEVSIVKRNSSNSSKSSGNFEDEAFYSCDENDNEKKCSSKSIIRATEIDNAKSKENKRKISSPSLTSRVAAKINETTNNYKNRKAANKNVKTGKTLASNGVEKRPEFYKQLSVERLNSTSIVRQPSDRRPDSSNVSLRSNGNLSSGLNSSDLQSSFNNSAILPDSANCMTGNSTDSGVNHGATVAQNPITSTQGAMSGNVNAANGTSFINAGSNALDATAEGKDARRERYHNQQNKSAPVSVNRSESYKERLSNKRNRHSRRKTSDPSLTSRQNDEQSDIGLSNSNYTGSSNSSLSSGAGSESPSTSMEQVGVVPTTTASQQNHHLHHTHHHNHQDSFHGSIGSAGSNNTSFWGGSTAASGQLLRQWNFDSDDEDDLNETDWSSLVASEILAALTDAEKKRQEIINEIYQTERSHVRTLKLLDRLFFCPLQEGGVLSNDHLMLLFPPALVSLRDLHGSFEQQLKQRRQEHNHVVKHIGDLLASMFDGPAGDDLREYAAQFCARQQIALEALKEKRRKDEQLQKILNKAESHKACRRLQLKDLLPTVLQRLTKYPLLFENLYKVTIRVIPENASEAEAIQRALESSKKILVDVNQAVKTAEDAHKLQNIQRKLDKSTFDKDEFKNLDLTQYRLIHDGSLTMKKNPSIQLHGLLFDTMIVLLTKQDDKYSLKYLHAARNTEVNNKPVSPIMSIDSETLVRQEAADKNSFFLIKTKTSQMLELRAPSSSECKTWFKHISDAAEQYKPRSKNANHEHVDDPAITAIPHSNTKESLEVSPERPPPQSATATIITTPLAPMVAVPISAASYNNNNITVDGVQLRSERHESTPNTSDNSGYYNIGKMRLSQNELQTVGPSVNRTMSTRSCGEANTNLLGHGNAATNGVTLRHTQSARQANGTGIAEDAAKRDSASIVYSNNSNDTRTLLMQSPLVQPTAIQISISPAHTAEPVLTPAERLRRLDASIRDGLLEKQKIICDMFRVPIEHFHEIVDIAAMPEAPKDSADIALAAYEQVQSLTKVLNDYMRVTPEQVISAVSTTVCDHCNEKQSNQLKSNNCVKNVIPNPIISAKSPFSTSVSIVPQLAITDVPPPLPPPNKQTSHAQQQTPAPSATKLLTHCLEEAQIHEDDDGYCEIDELRLPALPTPLKLDSTDSNPPPLPSPVDCLKTSKPPFSSVSSNIELLTKSTPLSAQQPTETTTGLTPELVKRQSTLSTNSIPEESSDEIQKENAETNDKKENFVKSENDEMQNIIQNGSSIELKTNKDDTNETSQEINEQSTVSVEAINTQSENIDNLTTNKTNTDDNEQIEETKKEITETSHAKEKSVLATPTMVDSSTQTKANTNLYNTVNTSIATYCGPNRLQHVNSLEPSIPCHALNSIVSALNEQISLLLPKINERDMERERLRKENQHLRELLNAMHEHQRVQEKSESPESIDNRSNLENTDKTIQTALANSDAAVVSAFEGATEFNNL